MTDEQSVPVGRLVWTIGVAASGYHLATAWFGTPIAELHRPLHLFFVLLLVAVAIFGGGRAESARGGLVRVASAATIAIGCVAALYIIWNAHEIQNRIFYVFDLAATEKLLALGLLVALSEAARRTLGLPIVVLLWVFVGYAFLGQYLPPAIGHRGFSADRVMELIYITKDGVWGAPLGIAATFMFMFILFGALLASTGASGFFTDIAVRATAGWTGGPAKAAVVSSAFMSMLSGNAASNVATTGTVTIPTMKRAGYSPAFAAGVEAVASSGGQITPPVMGAAAFLIVEFTGISYGKIMLAAIGPALLYFIALFAMVHFEARRLGLSPLAEAPASTKGRTPLPAHAITVLASLAVILAMMFSGYTPTTAALWGILTLVGLVGVRMVLWREPRLRTIADGLAEAPRMIAPVSIACAIGGVIAGITILTGLGSKVSDLVVLLSGGNAWLALLLTMIVAIVMGMGLPSSSAYIILAALLAPTLIRMGVGELPTHMFILFCGVSSTITPPVAIASYTAAAIAGANPWRTSLIAFRLGLSIYIIPFMFVANPGLLMQAAPLVIAANLATAFVGIIALSAAVIGHGLTTIGPLHRLGYLAAALLLIEGGVTTDIAGATLLAAGFLTERRRFVRQRS